MSSVKELHLKNFRIHKNLDLEFEKNPIIFIGDNAIGKTSILEAIYYLSTTKSFRSKTDEELIALQEPFSKIMMKDHEGNSYSIVISKEGKSVYYNRIEKKKISDYIGSFRSVLYSAYDMELLNGSPASRRKFLDLEIAQLDKSYLSNLNRYRTILKQRNELLKKMREGSSTIFLNIMNEQLIEVGEKIIHSRKKFVQELNEYFIKIHQELFQGKRVSMVYHPSVEENEFEKILKEKESYDIFTSVTNYGPHRDDFSFEYQQMDFFPYSSQGEQKSLLIALKCSLVDYIEEKTKEKPILLLDDLFSYLDVKRQNAFLSYIQKTQTFITTTDINNILKELLDSAEIYEIKENTIKGVKIYE